MQGLPAYWDTVIDLLAGYIEAEEPYFTLQATGGDYEVPPYVQALREYDGMLLIESCSNQFLKPALSEHDHETLLFMGWRLFPEDYYPNYAQIIDLSAVGATDIATKMARALHFAYGVDEGYQFEIAPQNVVSLRFREHLKC
jgi:hypothetical protein